VQFKPSGFRLTLLVVALALLVAELAFLSATKACIANIGGVLERTDLARVAIKIALGQGCHYITVSWTPSTSSGVTGYNIYRGTSPGGESSTPLNTRGPVTGSSFIDVKTVRGTTYYYIIRATNGSSESTPSTEVRASAR
jgi:hypothetical protein